MNTAKRDAGMGNIRFTSTPCAIEQLERRVLFVLFGADIDFGVGGHTAGVAANLVLNELPDGKILTVGSVLHNNIDGGDGNDKIVALPLSGSLPAGAATLRGGDGNDSIQGGAGRELIYGGAGNDVLRGGAGGDLVSAGGGNDRLFGEGGNDRLYGGAGRDHIYGGSHDDRLFGGGQGDWLYGQRGSNQLDGEGGKDRLYADYAGGDGVDTLRGGAGDDLLVARDLLADQLFGGPGNDTAIADEEDDDALAGVESVV